MYPSTLLNFRCPDYLKADIDKICKFRRMSRTALINGMFEDIVREWKPRLNAYTPTSVEPHQTYDEPWRSSQTKPKPITTGREKYDDDVCHLSSIPRRAEEAKETEEVEYAPTHPHSPLHR